MDVLFMPRLGMTMEAGEVIAWLKREGEPVERGEPVLEIATDKSNAEVESPVDGVLARLLAAEGDEVEVGRPLAVIVAKGEVLEEAVIDAFIASLSAGAGEESPGPAGTAGGSQSVEATREIVTPAKEETPLVRATPRVRRLAQELGVDLAAIAGQVGAGMISEEEVLRWASEKQEAALVRQRLPLTGVRKTLFLRMSQAWQAIPHFHQMIDIDAGPLLALRREQNVTLTAFFVRAAALALPRHPWINAALEGEEAILFADVNIGVAVAAQEGLLVPVIRHADRKSLRQIGDELRDLAARARAGHLSSADLQGGTFTVSNLGMYGIETGTPIINPPQVALLFVGATQTVPVLQGDQIVAGQRLKITLAYDHRLIDGITAAAFSQDIRQLLQTPSVLVG